MKIPASLKHKPVIVSENYENVDGRYAYHTDAKGLSLGLAQWNDRGKVDISAKVWRYTVVRTPAALQRYDGRYRAAFERYLSFLCFFYDHHRDPASYFWRARKLLSPDTSLDARAAFVRLMSGGADVLQGEMALQQELATRHARWNEATGRGRFAAAPGADLFRVRGTLATMQGDVSRKPGGGTKNESDT